MNYGLCGSLPYLQIQQQIGDKKMNTVIVYFETNGYAEKICTFVNEDIYLECLPTLERIAKSEGFDFISESLIEN